MTTEVVDERANHLLRLKVRDYECDLQGIVNNGVYQHYLEHARHEYLLSRGVSFAELAAHNIDLVVLRVELDYLKSLRPGDSFSVVTSLSRLSRVKVQFVQQIYRESDGALMLRGVVTAVAINEKGRPFMPAQLLGLLGPTTSVDH